MKKILFFLLVFLVPIALAMPNLKIEKIDKGSVIIQELDNPAVFNFIIENNGQEEQYEIFSLIGVSMTPKGFFNLPSGKTTIEVHAYPNEDLRKRSGFLTLEYQLNGKNSGLMKDTFNIKVVPISDIVEITSEPIHPDDNTATIYIKNNENTNIKNLKLQFNSVFFNEQEEISLEPYEKKNITIEINIDKKLNTGPYILKATAELENAKEEFEGVINFLEKEGTSTNQITEGLIIRKTTFTKTNQGNVISTATIQNKKDILSRLFTINTPQPDRTERSGLKVTYTWTKSLKPTESLKVTTITNYTIPFILIILMILIVIFINMSSQKNLSIKKRVSFVRTKGGELALKITLQLKAYTHIDEVQVTDTLPRMSKLYEKYGKKPDHIHKESRKISWDFNALSKGEERIITYIIYSKLSVVGRFELPQATAKYKQNNKTEHTFSNKTYFVAETSED